jgi:hypothetical protein
MTGLVRLDAVWGSDTLIEAPPQMERLRDALYLPWSPDRAWGVFDRDGLASPGAWEHGPQGSAVGPAFAAFRLEQPLAVDRELWRKAERISEPLVYGGRMHAHFGHFVLETLPRLWAVRPGRRFLVHGPEDLACLESPWLKALLGAMGLSRRDFVVFGQPVVCRRLTVPHPALRPQSHVHRAFGQLCRRVGARLMAAGRATSGARPAYLTKSGLDSGVTGLTDEAVIEARMTAAGVEVIRPETLPLSEQVALFAARPAILGVAGSAFHLGVFAPPVARQIRINLAGMVNSNHRLLDRLSGRAAVDLHQPGTELAASPNGFQALWRLPDPEAVATSLLDVLGR